MCQSEFLVRKTASLLQSAVSTRRFPSTLIHMYSFQIEEPAQAQIWQLGTKTAPTTLGLNGGGIFFCSRSVQLRDSKNGCF